MGVEMEVRGRSPVLVKVMVCGAENCPATVAGKASERAESPSVGGDAPTPLRVAVCVPAASVTVRVAEAIPA